MNPDGAGRNPRRGSRLAAFAVAAALLSAHGCVSRKSVLAWPLLPASGAYSAVLSGSLAAWGRGVPLSGICAVDLARGVRVELRDPLGATRLLLLASPTQCTLVSPGQGLRARWDRADDSIPWGPGDLWLVFTGRLPADVSRVRMGTGSADLAAWWRNSAGEIRGRFEPSGGEACPFRSAALDGPAHARLALTFSSVRPGDFSEEAFSPPRGDLRAASPRELLEALIP